MLAALNPIQPSLQLKLAENPDLYGPIWISSTFLFIIVISSSIRIVLERILTNGSKNDLDFSFFGILHKFSFVYGSLILFPMAFYFVSRFIGIKLSLTKTTSIYGYSIIGFYVTIIGSFFGNFYFQYLMAVVGGIYSGAVASLNISA